MKTVKDFFMNAGLNNPSEITDLSEDDFKEGAETIKEEHNKAD